MRGRLTVNGEALVGGDAALITNESLLTLSDGAALGLGSLAANSVAATAFTAGTASAMPAYHYANKLGAPGTLVLRAIDTDAVSSSDHAEGSTLLLGVGREADSKGVVSGLKLALFDVADPARHGGGAGPLSQPPR